MDLRRPASLPRVSVLRITSFVLAVPLALGGLVALPLGAAGLAPWTAAPVAEDAFVDVHVPDATDAPGMVDTFGGMPTSAPRPDLVGLLESVAVATPTPSPTATPNPTPHPTAAPRATSAPVTAAGGWYHDPEVSFYGPGFYGKRTACGQTLTTTLVGVANRTLPCGTLITFRNPRNGRMVTAPVVDRGPYVSGRQWDLTGGACTVIDACGTYPLDWRFGG